jgi:hypothetical protein
MLVSHPLEKPSGMVGRAVSLAGTRPYELRQKGLSVVRIVMDDHLGPPVTRDGLLEGGDDQVSAGVKTRCYSAKPLNA